MTKGNGALKGRVSDLEDEVEALKIELDASKNCLNCKHHLKYGKTVDCKLNNMGEIKICDEWEVM